MKTIFKINRRLNLLLKAIYLFLILANCSTSFAESSNDGNPYASAKGYINPDYVLEVNDFLVRNSSYKEKTQKLGLLDTNGKWNISTAIWLDNVAAIDDNPARGTHGIRYHLDEALKQASAENPVAITFVIYNLPMRDCDAYSSNGEFQNPEDLVNYQTHYIDKIKQLFDEFYQKAHSENVRSVLVIEPDSLPNLITNASNGRCATAASSQVYTKGISYALSQFSSNPAAKISMYIDIAHSGWLGWAANINKVADIYNSRILGAGFDKVRGFITNTANYTPLQEAFSYDQYLPNYQNPSLSQWIMLTKYYSWNDAYDEASFIAEIASIDSNGKLNQMDNHRILRPNQAKYANMHFLIDTSRNGWLVNQTDYTAINSSNNQLVNYARADQRHHRGNWCNLQSIQPAETDYDNPQRKLIPAKPTSAGLGLLPDSAPKLLNPLYNGANQLPLELPIDAYVWIKPPGESDGYYDAANASGDQMCSDALGGIHNDNQYTDSLQNVNMPAPKAGYFFDEAFKNLIDVRGCIDKKFTSAFCPLFD